MDIFFDRKGNPISGEKFNEFWLDPSYKIIKQEYSGKYWVSTVWLGINHGFIDTIPLLFETMIFCKDKENINHGLQERYFTEEEAVNGHEAMVIVANKLSENEE